jgi:[protein-PII] uridylyltransferase
MHRPADLFARICGYFDGAGFSIQDAKVHTTRTATRWTPSR